MAREGFLSFWIWVLIISATLAITVLMLPYIDGVILLLNLVGGVFFAVASVGVLANVKTDF